MPKINIKSSINLFLKKNLKSISPFCGETVLDFW